ncbi:MAG TPA: permease prefix domain 2-containing transporter [Chthonomonadaceae bacterium]|nr:permease prefix domain 2-containing transporter [Chthonomonadaceae bacterium]
MTSETRIRLIARVLLMLNIVALFLVFFWMYQSFGKGALFFPFIMGIVLRLRALIRNQQGMQPKDEVSLFDAPVAPKSAQLILYLLLPKKQREAVIGDLEEQYTEANQCLGKRGADFWYYVQVLTSVWPILSSWTRKLLKLGGAALLGHWLHQFTQR